jgi:phosphoribosylformylglycinamidine cyclo-ligase
MPGMYSEGDFDLAGFAVGAMERGADLPVDVKAGDVLLGLGSNGVHSNGYSLVRKLVEVSGLGWDATCPWDDSQTLGAALLAPTRLYVKQVLEAIRAGGVHALAHITGGGLTENLPRVLPEDLGATIDLSSWDLPPVFKWLAATGGMEEAEILKTFNCGIGMILVVAEEEAEALTKVLEASGETVTKLGAITEAPGVAYEGSLL